MTLSPFPGIWIGPLEVDGLLVPPSRSSVKDLIEGFLRAIEVVNDISDRALSQTSNELAFVQKQFGGLKLLQDTILSEISLRTRKLGRHQNTLLPISRLPSELLAEILCLSLEDKHGRLLRWAQLESLASVCQTWADIVNNTPRMWTLIDCMSLHTSDDPWSDEDTHRIVPALGRSKKPAAARPVYLCRASSRWKSLCCHGEAFDVVAPMIASSIPQLQHLCIQPSYKMDREAQSIDISSLTSLTTLDITNVRVDWTCGIFSNLTSLAIRNYGRCTQSLPRAHFSAALVSCTALESLALDCTSTEGVKSEGPIPTLPRLRQVSLRHVSGFLVLLVLSHVQADTIERLLYHPRGGDDKRTTLVVKQQVQALSSAILQRTAIDSYEVLVEKGDMRISVMKGDMTIRAKKDGMVFLSFGSALWDSNTGGLLRELMEFIPSNAAIRTRLCWNPRDSAVCIADFPMDRLDVVQIQSTEIGEGLPNSTASKDYLAALLESADREDGGFVFPHLQSFHLDVEHPPTSLEKHSCFPFIQRLILNRFEASQTTPPAATPITVTCLGYSAQVVEGRLEVQKQADAEPWSYIQVRQMPPVSCHDVGADDWK